MQLFKTYIKSVAGAYVDVREGDRARVESINMTS